MARSTESRDAEPSTPESPANPGILLVTSDTLSPTALRRESFDSWYISQHIPLVLTTGKGQIGTATRYQYIPYSSALPSHPLDAPNKPHRQLSFLTVYDLHDVEWVESEEFRSLSKEREGSHRDTVFKHAEFDARSYSHRIVIEEDEYEDPKAKLPPAPVVLTIMLSHSPDGGKSEDDMQLWFKEEHLPFFSSIAGYRTSRLSQLHQRSLSRRLKTSSPDAPGWLVMHEFDGMRIPGIGFRDAEGEMARLKMEVESKEEMEWNEKSGQKRSKEQSEVDFAFWSLMGEYWAKDE